jgi:hypothetical protein
MNVPYKLLARDLALLGITLLVWMLSRRLDDAHSPMAIPVAILAGLMAPVIGFLIHEWGHLIGAWVGHSVVHPAQQLREVFLFRYDLDQNSREQFLSMGYGGFIASLLFVAALVPLLSLDRLADRIALTVTALGVLATFVIEVPQALRVYRGGPFPNGVAFVGTGNGAGKKIS